MSDDVNWGAVADSAVDCMNLAGDIADSAGDDPSGCSCALVAILGGGGFIVFLIAIWHMWVAS